MGVIRIYVQSKENLDLKIAKEVEKLYLEGLSYNAALRKAKEIFLKDKEE